MKTKISLVLLALGLSSTSVYAGHAAESLPVSNDVNLTAPDQPGSWSFGAEAVLMQPTNKAFSYASRINAANKGAENVIEGSDNHYSVDEDYDWWFGADITYHFPGNGRDVTLAYEGLHGTDTESTAATPEFGGSNGNVAINVLFSSFTGLPYSEAEGKTKTAYDAGDLLFGQKIDVGHRVQLHPFVGIRYAHLDLTDTGEYFIPQSPLFDNTGAMTESAKLENKFDGVGPRLGSDAQINLGPGFTIRARLGLSALIGSQRVDNEASLLVQPGTEGGGSIHAENNSDSQTRVIPEIDGRLGLNYTAQLNPAAALGFELGWQATNYFNVVSDQYPVTLGPVSAEHYSNDSNFGLQGPYARVQLDIA